VPEAVRSGAAPGESRRRGGAHARPGGHGQQESRARSARWNSGYYPRHARGVQQAPLPGSLDRASPPETPVAGAPADGTWYLPALNAFRNTRMTLRRQVSDPLFRNGYALMANTAATGLLGVVYWLLAARHYAAVDVGRASATYSAMNLLSGLVALNLVGALTRFIPQSGHRTAGLVLRVYAFSALASVLVTVPFLMASSHLGPSYAQLSGVTAGLVFTAAVVCWSIFTLQDGVLVGLRSAVWVPIENGAFGIVKIVLLLALATSLPHAGIYVSWMLPVVISLPLVNALIFGRLIQRHSRLTAARTPPSARQIGRFLIGDYTGALCVLAVNSVVPLGVAASVAPSTYAYFYVAWSVGGVLGLFAINMATSLTVEGAFDEATLAANCRAALRKTILILAPISAAVAVGAPVALRLYGPEYAVHGAPILQLMAIAALPLALTEIYLGALRAQSRTSMIAFIQGVRGVLIVALAFALTGIMGTVGAGLAFLVSQVVVAAMVTPGLLSLLRRKPALSARPTSPILPKPRPTTDAVRTYPADSLKL
jgi:O-antigen/teichoic acid export membrane protein